MSTITQRKNVTLASGELEVVQRIRKTDTAERQAVAELVGIELKENPSEAESIRALIRVGLSAIQEKVNHDGYAALAAQRTSEDRDTTAAIRRRGAAYKD